MAVFLKACRLTVQALPTRSERIERSVREAARPSLGSTYSVRSKATKGPSGRRGVMRSQSFRPLALSPLCPRFHKLILYTENPREAKKSWAS